MARARTRTKRTARAGKNCGNKCKCKCNPNYYNVLGRPRKNKWGTRFGWNVHLEHIGVNTPITGSFASRIMKAKTGATLKGYALIDGVSRKITVHIYY